MSTGYNTNRTNGDYFIECQAQVPNRTKPNCILALVGAGLPKYDLCLLIQPISDWKSKHLVTTLPHCNKIFTKHIYYISGGNGLCAIATKDNAVTTLNYNYVYTDHLGSILKLTDNTGTTVAEQSFDAWGRMRDPSNWTSYNVPTTYNTILGTNGGAGWLTRGYTAHEHVPQVDLINMNGRMYDAVLGRMLSADRYVQDATNSQNYNRYSYALNNPLKYTDPSGWLNKSNWGESVGDDGDGGGSGGGGIGYIGGQDLTGGGSTFGSYNYMGSYSAYVSNPALYGSIYGTQTWMQQATQKAYEESKKRSSNLQSLANALVAASDEGRSKYNFANITDMGNGEFALNVWHSVLDANGNPFIIGDGYSASSGEIITYSYNADATDFTLTVGGTMNDLFNLAGDYAIFATKAVGAELITTSKFLKGTAGIGIAITLATTSSELVSKKWDTHTWFDLGVSTLTIGLGFALSANPIALVGIASFGLVYGVASFMGLSDCIDAKTNHWGYEKMYGEPFKKLP